MTIDKRSRGVDSLRTGSKRGGKKIRRRPCRPNPTGGPFLERNGNLTGPVSYFEIEISRKVGCVLTSNEVYFVSLTGNFTV